MAPSLVETPPQQQQQQQPPTREAAPGKGAGDYKEVYGVIAGPKAYNEQIERYGSEKYPPVSYPNYLPTWDFSIKYPPLETFQHYEHGRDADPTFPDLLKGATVDDVTGNIGVEIRGVQLSKLTDKGKDQLALYTAQKGVVAFRDQDFADLPIGEAVEFARYFGRLHIHPTSAAPEGHPEVHVVHRGAGDDKAKEFFVSRMSSTAWHTDISYEKQPPGTTFLYMLDGPKAGGDTVFSNQVEAYRRLSPEFQKRLHGLKVVHSAHEQAQGSAGNGGVVRRDPVASVHPLVRTHPATGEKALYINPQFCRKIVGYKEEESHMLLKFLFDHIAYGQDFQCRVKWAPGTVIVWDNRTCAHSAITDWHTGVRRHIARITPQAEEPYETAFTETG